MNNQNHENLFPKINEIESLNEIEDLNLETLEKITGGQLQLEYELDCAIVACADCAIVACADCAIVACADCPTLCSTLCPTLV